MRFSSAREVKMKRLAVIAAILMLTSAAHAQYTFEYGGKTIRIDPDRGTVSIPGIFDNTGPRSKRSRNDQDAAKKPSPDQAKTNPRTPAPSPPTTFSPPSAAADPATAAPPADAAVSPTATAKVTPADAAPPKLPVQAATPEPLGLWLTEEKKGRVRIEHCGVNLCGYSVDPKSNQNGEQVLIDMKPDKDASWSGRIFDSETGSTYDSTIALKGLDRLQLQGCAFGGIFCGGQTWSRLN
jgi:uncharacterized protein (DUF2147 family)